MGLSPVGHARSWHNQREPAPATQQAHGLLTRLIDRLVDEPEKLSAKLLERYGSIAAVVTAFANGKRPADETTPDCVAEYFGLIADTLCRADRAEPLGTLDISSPGALSALLRQDMLHLDVEVFRVIFLDGRNAVISDQVMWTGTVNSVQAHPREIVKQAIMLGATALILAHNHPSSSAHPSGTDVAITRNIVVACAAIDVDVHDHMIVARDGAFSMRSAGMLKQMKDGAQFR